MSSARPPPSKKPRRSPHSGSSVAPNQLTLTSMLRKNKSEKPNEKSKSNGSGVLITMEDLPSTSSSLKERKCEDVLGFAARDCSPELFSDSDGGDGSSLGCGRLREGSCDNKTEVDEKEKLVSSDKDSELCVILDSPASTPVRRRSPSLSTRSSTHSPEIDLPPWDGAPLNEIHFGPSTFPVLPPLQSNVSHSVLFHPRLKPGKLPIPFPSAFKEVWDSNHVRMPCSSQSMFPVAMTTGGGGRGDGKTLVSRWDVIKESLSKPITNSYDLEEVILTYNSRKWSFYGLHSYFSDHCSEDETRSFFGTVLPRIVDLALSLPKLVTHALPLLKKQLDYSVSLSQQQVACLLANAFLCTFPRRNARGANAEYSSYPSINFNPLFCGDSKHGVSAVTANKLTCLFHYFTR